MKDENIKIELEIIDVNENPDKNKNDVYSFDAILKKVKRKQADIKTSMINCPFCKDSFNSEKLLLEDEGKEKVTSRCPYCGSILKIYRK